MSLDHATAQALACTLSETFRVALIGELGAPASTGGATHPWQEHDLVRLACALARLGVQIDLFTWHEAVGQHQLLRRLDGVRIIHMPVAARTGAASIPARMDAFARSVARYVRSQLFVYRLAHAGCLGSGLVALHLKKALGLPFVLGSHALGRSQPRNAGSRDTPPAQAGIEAALAREAAAILADSEDEQGAIEHVFGAARTRIAVAASGYAPDALWPLDPSDARRRLRLPQERFTVLHIGRMRAREGADTVVRGVAMLRTRYGIDAGLLLVGPGALDQKEGHEQGRIRCLADELGIAAALRFGGPAGGDTLRDYYNAADVVVSMPWHAGPARTALEAMACARPVVGAELSGIRSYVEDGVTGYLIPPRDAQALAERLARLARQPALARMFGEAGHLRASRHHTWGHVAQRVLEVYESILRVAPAPAASPHSPGQVHA